MARNPAATTRVSALGVEEQRVNVIIDVSHAPTGAGDGFRLDADIVVTERPSTVIVSPGALVRTGVAWGVFIVDGGRARLRHVRTGAMGDTAVEILEGVDAGDRVIAFPSDRVRDGVRIRVRQGVDG